MLISGDAPHHTSEPFHPYPPLQNPLLIPWRNTRHPPPPPSLLDKSLHNLPLLPRILLPRNFLPLLPNLNHLIL